MSRTSEEITAMMTKAAGKIPANPEVQAKMATETLQPEQPVATPPEVPVATPVEQGLEPGAADFFGNLADSMDAEVSGVPLPEPVVPAQQPRAVVAPVVELPYEPPVTQRQPGELPESLEPQPVVEPVPLEAAIERPIAEEEVRLTAEQWAAQQQTLAPTPQAPAPVEQPRFDPAELEAKAIEQLTTTEYALTPEDKVALIAEPDTVIPRLAARMHVRMQVQLAQQIAQILPGIVQAQLTQANKVSRLETAFFGQYPELDKPQFHQTVQESLAMIRQVNPQATREEVMRDGAALAAVRLRTRLGAVQEQAQLPALPQMPLAPSAVPALIPAPVQPQAPFTPAQSGGASEPVVPTDPNQNIFADLAMDPDW
ncbi:hypothetical protein LCGC14_1353200 [marine sediment metagenome]|uniref:Uncharacterized protein n=1 Tax=marine sediment metagenome TaxID=412755 RepID=A0A0F9NCJ6_9ZZZZ